MFLFGDFQARRANIRYKGRLVASLIRVNPEWFRVGSW